jgi:hypothetical protein
VSDYGAFVAALGEPKKDGDFDVVHLGSGADKDQSDTFVAHWGNYAALSDKKENLAKKPDGFKATGATAKELDAKDVVAVVNMKVLGPKINEQLKAKKGEMLTEVQKALQGDEKLGKYAPLIQAVVNQALASAEEFLADTQYASFSVNLNDKGIGTTLMADFDPASYLGKAFGGVQNTGGSMLAGLPAGKYLVFAGSVTASNTTKALVDDFLKPIDAELAKAGDEMKPVIALVDAVRTVIENQKASVVGILEPSGALGASALFQTISLSTGDAKKLMGAQAKALEAEEQLMSLMPQPGGQKRPQMKFTFTPNAKSIDGVDFAQFTTGLDPNDNSPEAMQAKQMLAIMYGPNGASGYVGALDDQHLLQVSGIDDTVISAAIKAAKEKQDNFKDNESLKMVASNLPQQRVGEFYIAVDEIINTVSNYAKMMGIPIPVNMKPNLPPLGVTVGTEGPALRVDSYVPSDLVEAIVTTTIQLRMMGGGRGKPGGL